MRQKDDVIHRDELLLARLLSLIGEKDIVQVDSHLVTFRQIAIPVPCPCIKKHQPSDIRWVGEILQSLGSTTPDFTRHLPREEGWAGLRELFPGRRMREVRIDNIAIGGGGIHCITQQEPA